MDRSNLKEAFFNLATGTPAHAHVVSYIDGRLVKLISQRKRLPNATEDGHHHVQRIRVEIDGVSVYDKQKTHTAQEANDALKTIVKAFDKNQSSTDQVVDLVYVSLIGKSSCNFEGFVSYHYVKVHAYTYLPNPVVRETVEPVVEVKVDGYPFFTVVGYVPENIVKEYAESLRKKLNEKQVD